MEIRNCKNCKRLFNYLSGPRMCPACIDELEKKFAVVKEYLWEHPDAPMAVISEEFDVPTQQIKQWIREERIILSESSPVFLDCEDCGGPIKSGRFCNNCRSKLQSSFNSLIAKPEVARKRSRDGDKMRFLDK